MAIRTILAEEDDILKKKSRTVTAFDKRLHTLIDDMIETLGEARGAGLAAVQVGVLRRVVVIDVGDGPIELVNPKITASEGTREDVEGCLSCPGKWGITRRPAKVTAEAQDRNGNTFTIEGENILAQALCHEIDHLDGKLFYDHVVRMLGPDEVAELSHPDDAPEEE